MSRALTEAAIERAARQLGVDVPAIRAVIAVETNGAGFLSDGRPKILYERHKFHEYTDGKFSAEHADLSNPVRGGYLGKEAEYSLRLYRALQLDADAAVQATSWGLGQIMGANWRECGERSLLGFLLANHNNEDAQLGLMVGFIKSKGLGPTLSRRDWATFARIYNGPAYAKNQYDVKLAHEYAVASKRIA